MAANNRRRKDFHTLPIADRQLLESLGYKDKLAKADQAIAANAEFLNNIVANPEIFGHDLELEDEHHEEGDETGAASSRATESAEHGSSPVYERRRPCY